MEDYKKRMRIEYRELKKRCLNLQTYIHKIEKGNINNALNDSPIYSKCPIYLLYNQLNVMIRYLLILEERAVYENIKL